MSEMMKTLSENLRRVAYRALAGLIIVVGLVLVAGTINAVEFVPSRGEENVIDRSKESAYLREATTRIETMTRSTHRFAELIRYPESTDDWYSKVKDEFMLWRKDLDWWQESERLEKRHAVLRTTFGSRLRVPAPTLTPDGRERTEE